MTDYYKGKIGLDDLNIGEGTFLRLNSEKAYDSLEQINLKDIFSASGESITGLVDWFYDIDNYDDINDALDTIGSDTGVLLITSDQEFTVEDTVPSTLEMWIFPGVTVTITASVTISGNVFIGKGAMFSIASSKTLTITNLSSVKVQPSQQWITGDGTLTITNQDVFGYAEAFGIDGTDDHTEINKAIVAFKRVKLFGDTRYVIDNPVVLYNDSALIGENWTSVLQAASGYSDNIIENEDQTAGNARIRCENFSIDGNDESCACIVFLGSANTDHNIFFIKTLDNKDRCIYIENGTRCKITHNKILDFGAILTDGDGTAPEDDGIAISTPNYCEIINNYIANDGYITSQHTDSQTYGRHGISVNSGCVGNKIIGNTIYTVERDGINIGDETATGPERTIISNNYIYDAGKSGISGGAEYLTITNNTVENCGQNGILLKSSTAGAFLICDGNIALSCGDDGITGYSAYELAGILVNGSGHIVVSNNTVSNSGNDGIELHAGSGVCNGNICYDNDVNGIELVEGNFIINDNICDSNDEDGIEIEANNTDFTLNGNMCKSNGVDGIEIGSNTVGIIGLNHCVNNTNTDMDISASFSGSRLGNSVLTNGGGFEIITKTTELTGMSGATVTWSSAIPTGVIVIGVSGIVTTLITGASAFDIGDGSDADLFGNDIGLAADTKFDLTESNGVLPARYTSATDIVLTAITSNFTAGAVRLTVTYINLVSPYT
jgi:parallel beta-helix repeat protein